MEVAPQLLHVRAIRQQRNARQQQQLPVVAEQRNARRVMRANNRQPLIREVHPAPHAPVAVQLLPRAAAEARIPEVLEPVVAVPTQEVHVQAEAVLIPVEAEAAEVIPEAVAEAVEVIPVVEA